MLSFIARRSLLLAAVADAMVSPAMAQEPRMLTVTRDLVLDPETQDFNQISSVLVRKNGAMVVVAERNKKQLREYDTDGRQTALFGPKGAGPGEFMRIGSMGWVGDTIWIVDGSTMRLNYVDAMNRIARTERLPIGLGIGGKNRALLPVLGQPSPSAAYPDGDFLYMVAPGIGGVPMPNVKAAWYPRDRDVNPVIRTGHDGVFKRLVALAPSSTPSRCYLQNSNWSGIIPFCRGSRTAIARDGRRIAMLFQDNHTAGGAKGSYRVVVLGERSDTIFSRTMSYIAEGIPAATIDSQIAAFDRHLPMFAGAYRGITRPRSYTPAEQLVLGEDGTVWINLRTAKTREVESLWLALDPRGATLGQVLLPARAMIRSATATTLWVTQTDEDDLPSLVRYQVK